MPQTIVDLLAKINHASHLSRLECERHGSLATYRRTLAELQKRREQYHELQEVIAKLKASIDATEQKHALTVAPLQRELDNESTPTNKRVQLRAAVIKANVALEAELTSLREQIQAAETEASLLASRGIDPVNIESACAESCGPAEETERLKILRRTAEYLNVHAFGIHKNAQYMAADTLDPEGARLATGVSDMYGRFEKNIQDEINEIRKRRIAQLYAE